MLVALEQLKKGNVRSSYHELQRGPRSLLWASDIHFLAGFPMSVTLSRFFSTPHPPSQPIVSRNKGGVTRAADSLELQRAEEHSDQGWLEQEPLPGTEWNRKSEQNPLFISSSAVCCSSHPLCSSSSPQWQQLLNQLRTASPPMTTPPCPWWRRTKVSARVFAWMLLLRPL